MISRKVNKIAEMLIRDAIYREAGDSRFFKEMSYFGMFLMVITKIAAK